MTVRSRFSGTCTGHGTVPHSLCALICAIVSAGAQVGAQTPTPDFDANNDHIVDALDLLLMQQYWHTGQGALPTPTFTATVSPTATQSPRPTDTPGEHDPDLTITLPGGVTMDFVLCPPGGGPGSFQMGSDDPGWSFGDELPVHTVTFAQGFYMGKYEVTQGQWQAIMGSNPSYFSSCGSTCPVEQVSWNHCQTFIANLNNYIAQTGQGPATFRLPSEAEWEYACRAGTTTRFSFGVSTCQPSDCASCDLSNYAWWCDTYNNPYGTKPVGGKLPNAWGLYDLHGNVWEWCEDWWNDTYNGAPTDGSAWTQGNSSYRVLRGGYWSLYAQNCRSACRDWDTPTSSYYSFGFRLSRTL